MAKNTDLLDLSDHRIRSQEVMSRQQLRDELITLIVNEVKATQSLLIQPFPNILLLNRTQFDILRPSEEFEPTDELIWKTIDPKDPRLPLNMMDIHVKGEFEPKPSSLLLSS